MAAEPVQRASGLRLIRITIAFVAVGVVLNSAGVAVTFKLNADRIEDIQQATYALCALRDDLERRVESSRRFLKEHPHGIPGIPAKTIRDGIRNQERTISALTGLSCPPEN